MASTSRFSPSPLPTEIPDLVRALEDEFRKVQAATDAIIEGNREVRTAEPERLVEGMIVVADGTEWDPGHGSGPYIYKETDDEWHPLFDITAGVVVARNSAAADGTTNEVTIYSHTLPANFLHTGDITKFFLSGVYSAASASRYWTLRFKLGGSTLHTIVKAAKAATDEAWMAEMTMTTRSEGATGTVIDYIFIQDNGVIYGSADTTVHTVDTTGTLVLEVTAQWDTANAGNLMYLDQGYLEVHHH